MKRDRLHILFLGVLLLWGAMWLRAFQIQIVEGEHYGDRADSQSRRRPLWKPERGDILDRDGNVLATNQPVWNKNDLVSRRIYPEGALASQLLGFTGRDGQGLQGLEYSFDDRLRGVAGWYYQTVDARKRPLPGLKKEGLAPTPGWQMVLTIHRDYQEIMENALAKGVTALDADRGSAILMDPNTGEVLAMASWPGFDPNKPHTVQGTAIRNDLVSLVFEPGSTFKLITASAALEEHTISLQTMVDSENGRMVLSNGEVISDTKDHGVMNVNDAMAYSSNVAFAKIAKTVGDEKFYRYVRAFGIGSPTMIHVPGEESGMLKPVANWSARTILTMAFGHEVLTTPLQIAVAYAVVANGGELIQPRVIKEFRDSETGEVVQSFERKVIRRVISQETAAKVRNMLRDVVQKGTATNIKSEKLDFAGKTGTSEKYDVTTGRYNRGSMTSSFIGMVPASQPRYLCMVVVDEPRKAHVGGLTAGPIFKEIMERIYYHPIVSPAQYQLVHAHAGNKCQSANFIGLSQKSSKQLAADIKCAVAFQGQGGQVVAQRMAQDSTADLVLQLGSMGNKKMPDLRGLSLRDALDALGSARSLVRVEGKGWVVTQDPLPHTSLVQGQPLRLFLREKT